MRESAPIAITRKGGPRNMGGVRSFRIESKRFDFIREGDGIDSVSLIESGHYMRHSVSMGKEGARWLRKCIEENIAREMEKAFIHTFRESDKGYVIRRFNKLHGRYLEVTDYGRGGCKGRLAIPEGQNQSGWRGFNKELAILLMSGFAKPVEEATHKRIPTKERLGPVVSYADSLRIQASQPQAGNSKPPNSQGPVSKSLELPEITQSKIW